MPSGYRNIIFPAAGGGGTGTGITAVKISASGGAGVGSDFTFSNANGLTFGIDSAARVITGSYTIPAGGAIATAVKAVASVGSTGTITRFAPEDHQHAGVAAFAVTNTGNTAGNTRSQVGTLFIAASGGITASQSTAAAGNDTVWLSVATPVAQTNQSAIKGFGVSNTGATAGNTGISTGIDWVLAGSNLITLSQSTVGGGPDTIWIQHPAWLTTADLSANSSKYIQNWKLSGNTAGTTSSAQGTDLWLAGGNGVTISGSSNTISFSVATNYQSQAAYLTTAALSGDTSKYVQNWKLTGNTAGTTSSAQGTDLWFSGGNNVTVSGNSNTIVISVFNQTNQSAIKGFGASNTGNTAGNTGISTGIDWVIAGTNNITVSQSTAAGGPNTLWLSAPNVAAGNVTFSASANSSALGSVIFANSNNITFGLTTGSQITASFNGATTGSVYATGNTTQNSSSTQNYSSLLFNGLGGVSVGYSNGSIELSAPPVTQLTGINGISLSSAGSTISILPQWNSSYENIEGFNATLTFNGASESHAVAFEAPFPLSASYIRLPVSMTTNSTTVATMASATASASAAQYSTWNAVVYSLGTGANSQSLQSVTSGQTGFTFSQKISVTNSTQYSVSLGYSAHALGASTTQSTQYSISNTNYSMTTNQIATAWSGNRMLDIPFAGSISEGNFWLVVGYSSSSASAGAAGLAGISNCNVRYSNHYGMSMSNISFGIMGSTNQTSGGLLGMGSFSTAGGGTTNSIPISAISSIASNVRPYFQLLRSA